MSPTRILVISLIAAGTAATYLALGDSPGPTPPADLVLRGGRIVTLDDQNAEAQALAARDGRIVAVGSIADVSAYIGPSTQVIELNGQFTMPGLIEGHGHFEGIGESKLILDLTDVSSWDEIVGGKVAYQGK